MTSEETSTHIESSDDIDLRHHGDVEATPGLVDLAVNVRIRERPSWLTTAITDAISHLASYPDGGPARQAVARRHRREEGEVLLTSGAAEAFVLLARALTPQRAVVVHPQFTEPEAALRAAGHHVDRLVLEWPFVLDPQQVPQDADLVVIGNPTNPTSVTHPAEQLMSLARPGRVLVIDEAFADCVPGEPQSVAGRVDVPGLVVIRSLTKTWGLAGLRCGYLLAPAAIVRKLAAAQPLWPLTTVALAAITCCSAPDAVALAEQWAAELSEDRAYLAAALSNVPGIDMVPDATASFLLAEHAAGHQIRESLRESGFAVRRGDTFPGLGRSWFRVAVRDQATTDAFVKALVEVIP
jgi:histidinol-phosphate aminotransferase